MRRQPLLIAPILATALVATGCVATADPDKPDGYAVDGTFTMALFDDIGTFNPYNSLANINVVHFAYDPLVNLRADGSFVSGLAEDWSVDATSATFTLRDDVTCSDGSALTAADVVAAINYVTNPENASPLYGWTLPAVPFAIEADDDARTVTITLEEPFGFILNTFGLLPIVCAAGLEDPDALQNTSQGTGPFVLTEVVAGQSYALTRRDGYVWGPGGATTAEPGTPKVVQMQVITNETTSTNLLLAGDLNYADINGVDRDRLEASDLGVIETAGPGAWLWFNRIGGRALEDRTLREALVRAFDLGEAATVNTDGRGGESTGLIVLEPTVCVGSNVSQYLPSYDAAAAAELLDEAGWALGSDGVRVKDGERLSIDLHYPTYISPFDGPLAEFLAEQWRGLGVEVELTASTLPQMSETLYQTSNYDVQIFGATFPLPTQATPFLSGPATPNGINFSGIQNADYDRLAAQARTMVAPEACEYWQQAEQALYENVDIVPIADVTRTSFYQGVEVEKDTGWRSPVPTSIRVLN